jgi:hypothetical protein
MDIQFKMTAGWFLVSQFSFDYSNNALSITGKQTFNNLPLKIGG